MTIAPSTGNAKRLWLFTFLVGVLGLSLFALVDVLEVHVLDCAPLRCSLEWLLAAFLLCVPVASFFWFKDSPKHLRIQLTVVGMLAGQILATGLVFTVGFWFHIAIGGGI